MTPRRKDVEPLARERIVEAAMKIIDEEGLDALSMRRLGAELGVNPMAAYYHVPNKAALYDLVLEAIMGSVDVSAIDRSQPLVEQLKQCARAYRHAILLHPRAIPVVATRPVRTIGALKPVEPILGIFFEAGFTPIEAMAAVDAIAHYILGGVMGYYHHRFDEAASDQREFEIPDSSEFPNLVRMIEEAEYVGDVTEFEFGLDALARGLLEGSRLRLEEDPS